MDSASGQTGAAGAGKEASAPKVRADVHLYPVLVDEKWGYIDGEGKTVIKPQFTGAARFSHGLAAVQTTRAGKVGFIDETGKIIPWLATKWENSSDGKTVTYMGADHALYRSRGGKTELVSVGLYAYPRDRSR